MTRASKRRDQDNELSPPRSSSSSQAHSTQPIMPDSYLDPPHAPFQFDSRRASAGSSLMTPSSSGGFVSPNAPRSRNVSPGPETGLPRTESNVSLTVNYIPSKFSNPMLATGPQRRRNRMAYQKGKGDLDPGAGVVPKMGGGLDAFRRGEARMGGDDDDDDNDNDSPRWVGTASKPPAPKQSGRLKWNKFKWTLFFTNLLLTIYSFTGLIFCLLTWFNVFERADIVRVGNRTQLAVSTVAACMGIFTSLLGWAGILLNNRSFLAVYTFLTWITFIFLLVPGYLTYKMRAFNLEGKINAQWSQALGADGRLRIQDELQCCGYFSPFVEATITQTCYARSILPGCKLRYLNFERMVLKRWYTIAFGLVPAHILVMVAGLLCSNHVTYRFGKGMMPKAYRLSMTSMAIIMDNYASQLAEQYGSDVASDILTRSRSNLHLDAMPTMPYVAPGKPQQGYGNTRYDSVSTKPPSPGYI
ncbi:hypothetical protein D9619_007723 [Psilocybe cf. subviscida]|uniref:Tetraspanin Tsp2 n=1 Tax=Psilocybe cf. subviscida TaxID=2480587 RepID=A0A8H5AT84_9AGAR|nr:hypothetical protein D9619_007723 [Psilocybe cf. subviscida]